MRRSVTLSKLFRRPKKEKERKRERERERETERDWPGKDCHRNQEQGSFSPCESAIRKQSWLGWNVYVAKYVLGEQVEARFATSRTFVVNFERLTLTYAQGDFPSLLSLGFDSSKYNSPYACRHPKTCCKTNRLEPTFSHRFR